MFLDMSFETTARQTNSSKVLLHCISDLWFMLKSFNARRSQDHGFWSCDRLQLATRLR